MASMPTCASSLAIVSGILRSIIPVDMDRQPNRVPIRSRPRYPVPAVCRNEQVIARKKFNFLRFALKFNAGLAAEQQYPLVPVLIIPKSVGTPMPARDNPFNGRLFCANKILRPFLR